MKNGYPIPAAAVAVGICAHFGTAQGIEEGWIDAELARLRPGIAAAGSGVPASVATQGPWLVVGLPLAVDRAGVPTGEALVYRLSSSGTWTLDAELFPRNGAADEYFGVHVAISGDTLVVGATGFHPGSVHVFTRCHDAWVLTHKIESPTGQPLDAFGVVAIDGDTIVVGAPGADTCNINVGFAEVFVRDDNGTPSDRCDDGWILQSHLTSTNCKGPRGFGSSVDLEGDWLVIGAPLEETPPDNLQRGAVYVFERSGNTWTQQALLTLPELGSGDGFGFASALDSEQLLVGTTYEDVAGLFRFVGGQWTLEARLHPATSGPYDSFGWAVALDGALALVGAPPGKFGRGSVHLYSREGSEWREELEFTSGRCNDSYFGSALAMRWPHAFVAAPQDPGSSESERGSLSDVLLSKGHFARFGFGDGSGTACPCGNDVPCIERGCRNSTGHAGALSIAGSDSASADAFYPLAANLLPGQPAILFGGPDLIAGGDGVPFGNGLRVVGGVTSRLGIRLPDAEGIARWGPGIGGVQGWTAGETRHFQVLYRDPYHSACVDTFNLTNGVSVLFQP